MRYTVTRSVVQVVGTIWMPMVTAATEYEVDGYAIENMRDDAGGITRDSVSRWVDTHAGDFSAVADFRASLEVDGETVEIEWASEESELTFNGCMYPEED